MCPVCLTSLAVTVATTTGIGTSVAAVAMRVTRAYARRAPASPGATGPAPAALAPDTPVRPAGR